MPFMTPNVSLSTVGHKKFRLEDDLCYEGSEDAWTVPAGFETDFATVPRVIQWLVPTYGKYTLAAILHDWFCVELARARAVNDQHMSEKYEPPITARNADGVFRRTMRELGVPFAQRWLIWTGVRWGAVANKARRKGIAKDLPLMVLVSILAAPIVVPASLIVGLGLLLAGIVNTLFAFFVE